MVNGWFSEYRITIQNMAISIWTANKRGKNADCYYDANGGGGYAMTLLVNVGYEGHYLQYQPAASMIQKCLCWNMCKKDGKHVSIRT